MGALYLLARFLFPTLVASAVARVFALPVVALALLALILAPIFSFEFTLGFWPLVKGVRIPQQVGEAT